jgi:hypothetical protein
MAPLLVRYTYLIERGMWHGVITVTDSHRMLLLQRETVLAPYVVYFTWQQITNNSSKLTAVKCCQNKLHIQKNCVLPQKHEYILCTSRHPPKSKHEDRNKKKRLKTYLQSVDLKYTVLSQKFHTMISANQIPLSKSEYDKIQLALTSWSTCIKHT